jgi:hypothetical protein
MTEPADPQHPPPDYRPKEMFASGQIVGEVEGPPQTRDADYGGDIMFNHPFGSDFAFNVDLHPVYRELLIEPTPSTGKFAPLHMEIEQRLFPHFPDGSFWFLPQSGDTVAVLGDWILDCGHTSPEEIATEIHPPVLLADARKVQLNESLRTVSHAFISPYIVSQLFNPSPAFNHCF